MAIIHILSACETFIDNGKIGEIGCMSIPKCHCGKSSQANLIFLSDAACWCGFVYAWSVLGIPTASCDNRH